MCRPPRHPVDVDPSLAAGNGVLPHQPDAGKVCFLSFKLVAASASLAWCPGLFFSHLIWIHIFGDILSANSENVITFLAPGWSAGGEG